MRYSSLTEAVRLLGCFGNDYETKPRLTCASAGEGSQVEDDEEEEEAANQSGLNFQALDTSHYFFHISSMDVEKRWVRENYDDEYDDDDDYDDGGVDDFDDDGGGGDGVDDFDDDDGYYCNYQVNVIIYCLSFVCDWLIIISWWWHWRWWWVIFDNNIWFDDNNYKVVIINSHTLIIIIIIIVVVVVVVVDVTAK